MHNIIGHKWKRSDDDVYQSQQIDLFIERK